MAKSKRKKRIIALTGVVLFFLAVWLFLSYSVNPVIKTISEQKVKELSFISVNNAANQVIVAQAGSYDSLLSIEKNKDGEIELMTVNSYLINLISREIATKAQENISVLGAQGIGIPLGSLSGLMFLAGHGPDINIKVYPVGSVGIGFSSEFISAGINQTKHRILLTIATDISVIMPGANRTINASNQVVLCESIIIGKVPDTYLNSNALSQMLNLIP